MSPCSSFPNHISSKKNMIYNIQRKTGSLRILTQFFFFLKNLEDFTLLTIEPKKIFRN